MKLITTILGGVASAPLIIGAGLLLASPSSASADDGKMKMPSGATELDPNSAMAALAAVIGGTIILAERGRRSEWFD